MQSELLGERDQCETRRKSKKASLRNNPMLKKVERKPTIKFDDLITIPEDTCLKDKNYFL